MKNVLGGLILAAALPIGAARAQSFDGADPSDPRWVPAGKGRWVFTIDWASNARILLDENHRVIRLYSGKKNANIRVRDARTGELRPVEEFTEASSSARGID